MKSRTAGALAIIAAAVIGVLAVALFRAVPVELAYPAERARATWARKVASRWHGLWRGVEVAAENVRLKREVASLAMDRLEVELLQSENARLRKDLAFSKREPGVWQAAEVLSVGGGAAGAGQTLRVGKGSLAGVREGAVVAVPEGLVGQVVSVTPHTAEVLLVTDPSLQVSVTVDGDPPLRGILSGGTEEALVVRHLRAGAAIAPQSRVLTSGLGGVFPAGILVGTFIAEGNGRDAGGREAGGLEREGRVRPSVDVSQVEDVFIRSL